MALPEPPIEVATGAAANDGSGDKLRDAFDKINGSIATLYGAAQTAGSDAPASASAAGVAGQIEYDANYIYVCVATNTWKRAALSSW